ICAASVRPGRVPLTSSPSSAWTCVAVTSPSAIASAMSFEPVGGGASVPARDSTTRSASRIVAPSISRPAVLYPTELTWLPGASLDTGADDGEDRRLLAREQIRGEGGAGGGASGRDRLAIHEGGRRTVVGVERDDHRLMRRPVGVARKERDELRRKGIRRRQERGHGREKPVALRDDRRDPQGHRDAARGQIRHRACDRLAEGIGIKETLDVG